MSDRETIQFGNEILNWLCPKDREPLVQQAETLRCAACGATYGLGGGIATFGDCSVDSPALVPLLRGFEEGRLDEALDEFCATHRCVNSLRSDDWKFLLTVPAGARILEVGAGYGRDSVDLARDAAEVVSLVPSVMNGRVVQQYAAARGATNVQVAAIDDLARLPLGDASVQLIVFEDAAARAFGLSRARLPEVAREWERVLAPGGTLLIGVVNPIYRSWLARKFKAGLGAGRERRSMNRLIKGIDLPDASPGLRRGSIRQSLCRLGLSTPETCAPLPDEDNTEFLVPLGDPLVIEYFLDHLVRKMTWTVRLAIRTCKLLLRLGLFGHVMPYHYLLFSKPGRPVERA